MTIYVLYVNNCSPTYEEFDSAKKAKKFIDEIVSAPQKVQDNERFVTGLVIGEFLDAQMDYEEKEMLERLKRIYK